MAEPSSQRAYRAACPGCGAPVEFLSASSTHAVCQYCSSTVVRSGEQLARIGKMAELFDDFSPLQLFATGRFESRPFTIVGRLQYAWADGKWNEWHCFFDGESQFEDTSGRSTGWLSEDNGQFVFMRELRLAQDALARLPAPEYLRLGMTTAVGGVSYQVTSAAQVHLSGAQGELPKMPPLGRPFTAIELRNADGKVLALDYGSDGPPRVYAGVGVKLDALQMQGLRSESAKEEKGGRHFSCPHCGAPVSLQLESSKTVSCGSCNSVINISGGTGHEVVSALQTEPVRPLIALGSKGNLQGTDWQVVGFQHRIGKEAGDDESFGWEEYLLYNRTAGFAFLVDATDGWSFVRPTTGAPEYSPGASSAKYLGRSYGLKYIYDAETTYVAGEFYWAVQRGMRTNNADFAAANQLLSREKSISNSVDRNGGEVTWSRGETLESAKVVKAFKLQGREVDFERSDITPLSGTGMSVSRVVIVLMVVFFVVLLVSMCSTKCDPQLENCSTSSSGYRGGTSGGSYGGWSGGGGGGSGGGGHK